MAAPAHPGVLGGQSSNESSRLTIAHLLLLREPLPVTANLLLRRPIP